MSPKFVLILYYLLPLAVFGQTIVAPNYPRAEFVPFGLGYYPEKNIVVPGRLHFPVAQNFVYDSIGHNFDFLTSGESATQDKEAVLQYGDDYFHSLGWKETFERPVYSEPISLKGMIRRVDNRMGASATGALVYTGGDDVFAYAHYGRTGKLIWRASPLANNMMATRWSVANFNIFRRASLPSISDQLR
jgi:hypothetical protein